MRRYKPPYFFFIFLLFLKISYLLFLQIAIWLSKHLKAPLFSRLYLPQNLLFSYKQKGSPFDEPSFAFIASNNQFNYLMIFATTPAPTVRPPSRIAKRKPSSIAIGWIKLTVILMLSPGITISTPSGNSIVPVTSVVRK